MAINANIYDLYEPSIQQFLLTLRDKKHIMDFAALSHILLLVHAIHGIYYGDVNLN